MPLQGADKRLEELIVESVGERVAVCENNLTQTR